MKYKIYIDGACRGNPGMGGAGVYIADALDQEVLSSKKYLGEVTNNIAEYSALILALEVAKKQNMTQLDIYADSELMVRQIQGRYKVKSPHLKKLYDQAKTLLADFDFKITHILRDKNKFADQLANEAIDEYMGK